MSVVSVKENFRDVSYSGDGNAYYLNRRFTVATDNPGDGPLVIVDAEDPQSGLKVPEPGDEHPSNEYYHACVPTISNKGPCFWEVDCRYATSGRHVFPQSQDPISMPIQIRWGTAVRQEEYWLDLDDKPVANVLSEIYDPPPVREVRDMVLRYTRCEAAFTSSTSATYCDTVCSKPFAGYPPGEARMAEIEADYVQGAGANYWRVSYEIHFRVRYPSQVEPIDAWQEHLLHKGLHYLDANDVKRATDNGQQVLLDGTGHKTTPDGAVVQVFKRYPVIPWDPLAL